MKIRSLYYWLFLSFTFTLTHALFGYAAGPGGSGRECKDCHLEIRTTISNKVFTCEKYRQRAGSDQNGRITYSDDHLIGDPVGESGLLRRFEVRYHQNAGENFTTLRRLSSEKPLNLEMVGQTIEDAHIRHYQLIVLKDRPEIICAKITYMEIEELKKLNADQFNSVMPALEYAIYYRKHSRLRKKRNIFIERMNEIEKNLELAGVDKSSNPAYLELYSKLTKVVVEIDESKDREIEFDFFHWMNIQIDLKISYLRDRISKKSNELRQIDNDLYDLVKEHPIAVHFPKTEARTKLLSLRSSIGVKTRKIRSLEMEIKLLNDARR